jgi:AbiV family abortive infection protein
MDFDTLEKLDNETIRKGVKAYHDTAKDLFECGQLLADKNKFGTAVALTVLSIEELIKGYAAFMFYVGDRSKLNIDAAFKGTIDIKSVHQARLKYASGLNSIISNIDISSIEKKFSDLFESQDLSPKKEIKTKQDLHDYFKEISEIIVPLIPKSEVGLTDANISAIEDSLKDSSNWFLHAKTQKENGFYADYINNAWHTPSNIDKEKYEIAKKYALQLFDMIGQMLEKSISKNSFADDFVKVFLKEFTKSTTA